MILSALKLESVWCQLFQSVFIITWFLPFNSCGTSTWIWKLHVIKDYKETSAFKLEIDIWTMGYLKHLTVKGQHTHIHTYVFMCVHIQFIICILFRNHMHVCTCECVCIQRKKRSCNLDGLTRDFWTST